jgi:hypothetical protein
MQRPNTNRSKDDAKAAKPPAEPPTTKHSGYGDNAEHVVIDRLLYQAVVEAKEIVYSGTDYGVCTQSTTTRMILRIRLHRSSVNVSARFINQDAVKRRK